MTEEARAAGPSRQEYELRLVINRLQQELNEQTKADVVDKLLSQIVEKEGKLREAEKARVEEQKEKARMAEEAKMAAQKAESQAGKTEPWRNEKTTKLAAVALLGLAYTPTGIYHLLNEADNPLLICRVTNHDAELIRRVRLVSYIEGYSAHAVETAEILPGRTKRFQQLPTLFPERLRDLHELARATLNVLVEDLDSGKVEFQKTFPIWLLSRNSAPLALRNPATGDWNDLTRYLGAFVTPNEPTVRRFLRKAARRHPMGSLVGTVELQVRAIFEALQKDGKITYVNSITNFNPEEGAESQRVRLPRQSLEEQQANCVDGVLLFASLLEAASLNPAIVILSRYGHALVGYESSSGSGVWQYLETTMIGSSNFPDALDIGQKKATQWRQKFEETKDDSYFRLWPLSDLRTQYGITPLE